MPAPFLADTNVYVTSARDPDFANRFERFQLATDPLAMSTVVLAELLLGAAPAVHDRVVRSLTAGAPAIVPTGEDWLRAASALSKLGGELVTKSRSFWNDAILAAQCERLGLTLITSNRADFRRLGRHIRVEVVAPFPQP